MLKLYISIFILFVCGFLFSQEKNKGDKIKQLKIVFITEKLELSTNEAELFWPLYREMEIKIKQFKKDSKKIHEYLEINLDNLSEDDLAKKTEQLFKNQLEEITIRKDYFTKFAKIIGHKKSIKLLSIEKEFKQKLLRELKKRKDSNINQNK